MEKRKVTLYMDVWPGTILETALLAAVSNPGEKPYNVRRYKIWFEIDDPLHPDLEIKANVEEVQ